MIDAISHWSLRHRAAVLGLLIAVSALAVQGLRSLEFDNSLEIWFLEGDPGIERYRDFVEQFGSDEVVLLAWEVTDAFSDETLGRLARLEQATSRVPHVLSVRSLASASIPRDEDGELATNALFSPPPADPRLRAMRAEAALASPLLTSSLLAPDGKAVAVVIEVEHLEGEFDYKREVLAALEGIVSAEQDRGGPPIALTGTIVLDRAFFDRTERDMTLFVPILLAVICVAMLGLFRRPSSVAVPMSVVAVSLLWTLGLQGLVGWKITVVSSVLAPLILAMGIADAVHVYSEYLEQSGKRLAGSADSRQDAIVDALRAVWRPCLFTSLTTAAGFLSLLVSPIRPVRQMGLLAACGVLIAFVVTIFLVPVVLSLLPAPPPDALQRHRRGPLARLLARLAGGTPRRWWASVLVATGLVAGAAVGIANMRVGTNMLEFFTADDPVRRSTERVDELIGGSVSVEYLIEADGDHGYLTPGRLARLDTFADYLRRQPNVVGVHGLTEVIKELDAAMRAVPASQGRLPDKSDLLAQYLMLIEGNELYQRFVRRGGRLGRFSLRVKMINSELLAAKVPEIDAHREAEIETPGFTLPGTGMVPLMNRMERFLLQSQLASFGLALLVISVMMMLVLGSVRLGALGMIPNLAPIAVTLGVMGVAGIRLDIGTVMIASVVLGLVVDDSIHLLARIQRNLGSSQVDLGAVVDASVREVGRPILVTSAVLVAGFWSLLFASFQPNIYFGLLAGVTILMALLADLILLPAILRLVRPRLVAGRD